MCLDKRFGPKIEKERIAKLPNKPITVYRWVKKGSKGYRALYVPYFFKTGLNVARKSKSGGQSSLRGLYKPGFHSYATKAGAKWAGVFSDSILIAAHIRKEWITAIGKSSNRVVYVTSRIIAPSCRDESAVI